LAKEKRMETWGRPPERGKSIGWENDKAPTKKKSKSERRSKGKEKPHCEKQ